MADKNDELVWMNRALELAERGRGSVEPNPLVGAVVVRDGKIVGEGWHQKYGQAHAEVNGLIAAGEAARGAALYVTLEPCSHHGKTPPCTDAIIRAGVGRVVAGMLDPFPQVAGQGAAALRTAGITVDVGPGEKEAHRLNAPYLKLLSTGRPYVHTKWAMSLDGKIATRTGESKWISGEASRKHVHELRGRMDAIIVGIGTVLADDPLLTVRPPGPRVPMRIVLDSQARLSAQCRLVQTAKETPVMLVTTRSTTDGIVTSLKELGCEVLSVSGRNGRTSVSDLLDELGKRRMTNVMVEGGSEVLGSFLDAGCIDEVHVFIAPKLIGGALAKTSIGGEGIAKLENALRLTDWQTAQIGDDIVIRGRRG